MKKFTLIAIIILAAFLRLYKLGSNPPSLYWDEASLGYNAYSILKTAKDEHGRFLPLTNFAAFGDYKPPGYIYATVPSVATFGLNEFAVRFPSALFGVLTVLLSYLLAKKLFENEAIAQLSALFLAISPWHLQFSRGAFEANLGLFFSTLGIYLFVESMTRKPFLIFFSALSFLIGMYTFTGQRLFVPFILLILAIQFKNQIQKNLKIVIVTLFIAAIFFWPLFVFVTQTIEGKLRFNEVTIFKDLEPIERSTRYRTYDQFEFWANIIHNRRFLYGREYLMHYFDSFNPSFLFIRGDANPRLSIQDVGELYLVDLLLIPAGIYFLIKTKHQYRFLILGWLLVSPLGPATARETPHALRMIHILPTFQILAAFGVVSLYQWVKSTKPNTRHAFFLTAIALATAGLLTFNFLFYLHMYYLHWPKNYSGEWQYGYKQAVEAIKPLYNNVDYVVVAKSLGRPYIYFLLYNRFDPAKYQKSAQVARDEFYFLDVHGFDKFRFADNVNEVKVQGRIVYVTTPDNTPEGGVLITTIKRLDGQEIFKIWKVVRGQS